MAPYIYTRSILLNILVDNNFSPTQVLFNLWKLHHNPDYWDEPWEFRPERFLDDDGTVVQPDHINRRRYCEISLC